MATGKEGLPKMSEQMWCADCDGYFDTDDYYACDKCALCGKEHIVRTSSFAFFYAYTAKHPDWREKLESQSKGAPHA